MTYSDLYFRSRSRPSKLLIFFALISLIGFSAFFIRFDTVLPTRATKETLKQMYVVNLSPTQAGVYWQTDTPEASWIVFGTDPKNLSKIAYDERDFENTKHSVINHYALLKDLLGDTTYFYKIVTNTSVAPGPTDPSYTLKTPIPFTSTTNLKPAYGKVITQNGAPATNVFVLLQYDGGVPLLALTKVTGEFLIPLQYTYSKDTGSIMTLNENSKIDLNIFDDSGTDTNIKALLKKISPLPQSIIIGKDYTFAEEEDVLPASTVRESVQLVNRIDILFPKENSIIASSRPLIKGIAYPDTAVTLALFKQKSKKPEFSYTAKADSKGEWKLNQQERLSIGSYTLVLSGNDGNGKKITVQRSFAVTNSGDQVLGDSTPAATLAPTATPTRGAPTPTPTQVLASNPTPTSVATLSPTAFIATATPLPTQAVPTYGQATITPTPTPPVTGDNTVPFVVLSVAFVVIGIGLVFVF